MAKNPRISSPGYGFPITLAVLGFTSAVLLTHFKVGTTPGEPSVWLTLSYATAAAGVLGVPLVFALRFTVAILSILHAIWAFVTGRDRNRFFTKIRGVTQFREAVSQARVGDELLFRLERKRDGGIKGVGIHLGRNRAQLGRFSKDRFPGIADQMLRGAVMTARVKNVTGGGAKETGINIEVHLVRPGQGPHDAANLSEFALGETV